eukprot:gnl/MRDRNA2_/MRDRNA2_112487_c0_seq1.p1 gnl/MRDRNA2_/MRDRNA2_112487_c0~~gnl/MRDRNA2_/MRDRNA2_112487_c0_seq1.p1  ORF type:complete len:644 (-),score=86.41 gnl/MRDRNA2_/MRDRNA2_112487_c0_seq1:146-1936(-)
MDGDNAKLMPTDNVYSYFMFLGPIERKKNPRRLSWNQTLAWLLIALNFFIQGTVLYAVFHAVVATDVIWRDGIVSLAGKSMNPFAPPASECNPGGSLCFDQNDTFTCAPPSVQLAGRWNDLDLDGDGIWTREEVLSARAGLECQYAVDPLEVFNVFVNFLKKRSEVIWLHPLVLSGQAIHKAYFDFAKGDIIMCNYRNEDMCPNLLQRGFFDGPLATGSSPRVGKTIESALDYCYDLLRSGGVCERSLPSTYSVWRKASEKQCFDHIYHKFEYKHPKTGDTKSLLELDYKAVGDYEKGRNSSLFMVYKSIIVGMFILCIFVELKDIFIVLTWVLTFPSEIDVDEAVKEERDSDGKVQKYTIQGITADHRMIMGILTVCRLILALTLAWVGVVFLVMDTDYVNLLLNGVALVFVIEVANCLYSQLLDNELREQCENTDPFSVSMGSLWGMFWCRNPAVRDLLGLFMVLAFIAGGMYMHYIHIAKPLSTALECTCLSQGDQCHEAQIYNKEFWGTYWAKDVPDIFDTVDQLKQDHGGDASSAPAPAAAANFIHGGLSHKAHNFATLKGRASPDITASKHDHTRRHRVTRLLNGHWQKQ